MCYQDLVLDNQHKLPIGLLEIHLLINLMLWRRNKFMLLHNKGTFRGETFFFDLGVKERALGNCNLLPIASQHPNDKTSFCPEVILKQSLEVICVLERFITIHFPLELMAETFPNRDISPHQTPNLGSPQQAFRVSRSTVKALPL